MTTFKTRFLSVIVAAKYLGKELIIEVFEKMYREILGCGLLTTLS